MIWDINPILFEVGIIELRYYGLLFAGGIYIAYLLVMPLMKANGLSEDQVNSLVIYVVISLVLGAHFVHLIFYEPESIIENPIRIIQVGQGLASHGGFLGAVIGGLLFMRKHKVTFWQMADPAAAVTGVVGAGVRIGNFFNSEIIGRPVAEGSNLPWAIVFKHIDDAPRHPAQLYEAVAFLVIFALLYSFYKKIEKRTGPGFIFYLFLALYFTTRFFIEYVKNIQSTMITEESFFTMGQWLSMPIIIFSLYMVYRRRHKREQAA